MKRLILLVAVIVSAAYAQAAHSVALSWNWAQGTGGAATTFNVKRGIAVGGPYVTIASPVISAPAYTDTSAVGNVLVEGSKYCYVITAVGIGGESANSNEFCATIPSSVPSAPTGLTGVVK